MVAAAMRMRYDQLDKQMVRDALEGRYSVVTDAEVPAEPRHIDVWATPLEEGASPPDYLGLLARITSGAVTVEFFTTRPAAMSSLRACSSTVSSGASCRGARRLRRSRSSG